jgi:hypothetical protein
LGFAEPGPDARHASRDRCLIAGAVIGSRNSVGVTRMDALPAGVRPGNFAFRPDRPICSSYQGGLYNRNAPRAACTLVRDAFKQSTESKPASIARIAQRRAAIQNCCLCPVQQNFRADPPVERGVKARPHQGQQAGFRSSPSAAVTGKPSRIKGDSVWLAGRNTAFAAAEIDGSEGFVGLSEVFVITRSYKMRAQ